MRSRQPFRRRSRRTAGRIRSDGNEDFFHNPDDDAVRFEAGCNTYGGRVEFHGYRLELGQVLGTQVLCPGAPDRREGWVYRVLLSRDLQWRSSGLNKLRLIAGDRVIKLHRRPRR